MRIFGESGEKKLILMYNHDLIKYNEITTKDLVSGFGFSLFFILCVLRGHC